MASNQGSSVSILLSNKVDLVEWLSSDLYFLQHAQQDGIIDGRVYKELINIPQPEAACVRLIDIVTNKGEGVSSQFLKLLKKTQIQGTYPQLKEWNPSSALPGPREPNNANISLSVPGPQDLSLLVQDKRNFFKVNRGKLVRNVKCTEDIVDDLIGWGFNETLAAKATAETTDQGRMRKILDSVSSEEVAEALFKGLVEHQKDVIKAILEGK